MNTNLTQIEQRLHGIADIPRVELVIQPLAQRSMFWRPVYLEQSAWLEHIPFAFWVIQAHQPRNFVELGSHWGVSYFAFCQAVERLGMDTPCFAVDTWKGDEHAGFYDERVFEKVKAHNDAHYSAFSRLVRSTFDEALEHFGDASIDLLHIDGLHTLEAVRHDFETWLPKISKRGVVVFHDTNVRERNFGVFKLFGELKHNYPHFEFVHGHGLGVLSVGHEQNELMTRLFAASKEEHARQSVREVFSRLGGACADTLEAKKQKNKVSALTHDLGEQKKQFEELQQLLERVRENLKNSASELADAKTRLQTQIEQHAAERGQLAERLTLLQDLRVELKAEVAMLQTRFDQSAAELTERTNALYRLEFHNQEFVKELKESNRESILAQEQIARQESSIGRLEEQLNQKLTEIGKLQWYLGERDADLARRAEALSDRDHQLSDLQSRFNELQVSLSAQLDHRSLTIAGLEADLKALRDENQRLSNSVYSRCQELATLTSTVDERDRVLAEKTHEAETLTKRIADVQGAQRAKDDEIARLKSQLASLQTSSTSESKEKVTAISKLEEDKKRLLSEKQALTKNIEARFKEIATLTNMLEERDTFWWRITAPLRFVGNSFSTASKARDTELKKNLSLIRESGLFDEKWYLEKYPDVASHGLDPVEHYLKYGAVEGRCPGPHFDTRWYLKTYPDVSRNGINALVHYVKFGKFENRRPKPE